MKVSIRIKFTFGMVFLFIIILILLGVPAFYMNRLSDKTGSILKENYLSVVYAREMSEGLIKINQEITKSFLSDSKCDTLFIAKEMELVSQSLQSEKNNITENGEDRLVKSIETGMRGYLKSAGELMKNPVTNNKMLQLQSMFDLLQRQLEELSEMNGRAFETKTDDAKLSAKNGLTGMVILGTICFLITLSFIYSFASYFNERFFQLYNGIKEIVASNYGQRLYFDGNDEFYEISLLFNQMAEKLSALHSQDEKLARFPADIENPDIDKNLIEIKEVLFRIKEIEKEAEAVILNMENKR